MRKLPFDYARCPGTTDPKCETCRRKEPGHPTWQSYITPRIAGGTCENYIKPDFDYRKDKLC
jgi:AAA+ ATPase superfamily predicted ATPase